MEEFVDVVLAEGRHGGGIAGDDGGWFSGFADMGGLAGFWQAGSIIGPYGDFFGFHCMTDGPADGGIGEDGSESYGKAHGGEGGSDIVSGTAVIDIDSSVDPGCSVAEFGCAAADDDEVSGADDGHGRDIGVI